ncbi:MAG: transposase, partial [Oligoflexales bacterium]
KKRAVEMSYQDGVSLGDVADELGVPINQLSGWRAKIGQQKATEDANNRLDALQENKLLKDELKQLRQENEILKKAAVFFASQK